MTKVGCKLHIEKVIMCTQDLKKQGDAQQIFFLLATINQSEKKSIRLMIDQLEPGVFTAFDVVHS